MNIQEIKDLMSQFDQSSLREFSYQNATDVLSFSKNTGSVASPQPATPAPVVQEVAPAVEEPCCSCRRTSCSLQHQLLKQVQQ